MDQETHNLLYRISCLEQDVKTLIDANKELAWSVYEKDKLIEAFKDQIRYMRELMPRDETLH